MPTPAELQDAIASAAAERGATEHFAAILRANLAAWQRQEAKRGPIAAALLHAHNETWSSRVERLAAELEQRGAELSARELDLAKRLVAQLESRK